MLRNVSPGLIENVKDLKISLNELTVYDFDVYSSIEVYYKIAHKLNDIIRELSRFEDLVSEEVIKQNNKLIYLLGEGLENEVIKEIDNLIKQNFFDDLVNVTLINKLNDRIDEVDLQLEYKANKNEVFTMANMGQDIKEAMTGGSVAVVGKNAILEENVVDGQISITKTDFIYEPYNLLNPSRIYYNKCILSSQTKFEMQDLSNYITTFPIKVKPNEEFTLCRTDNGQGILFNELDKNGKTLIYRHFSALKTSKITFTTTNQTEYLMISFDNINVFNVSVLAKASDVTEYVPYKIKLKNGTYDDSLESIKNEMDFKFKLNNYKNFIEEFNLINPDKVTKNTCILQNQSGFNLQEMSGFFTTEPIEVEPNQTYTLKRFDGRQAILFNELDENGKTLVYRHFSELKTSNLTFVTNSKTKYIMISFDDSNSLEVSVLAKTDNIEKYQPYTLKLKNSIYEEQIKELKEMIESSNNIQTDNYGKYFAYIKDGFLRCDKVVSNTCVSYNGLDLGGDDKKPYKALFQLAFEDKPESDSATATIISTKLGMRKVSDITEKSLHICFGQNSMHADFFENGVWTAFHTYTYSTPCIKDGKTLYTIGWEYVNSGRIKIYMPDGTSPIIDLPNGKILNDYCGRYNIFEHFTQNDNGSNKSRALFKKVLIWTLEDTTRPIIYDDFDKPNGSIGVTRSGHNYSQFILNNSDYQII